MKAYLKKRYNHTKYEPNINHFDICCLGQGVEHSNIPAQRFLPRFSKQLNVNMHCHEHKHHCEVDSDDGFKEESLKVDRGVTHDIQKDCW